MTYKLKSLLMFLVASVLIYGAVAIGPNVSAIVPGVNTRVSLTSTGNQINNYLSSRGMISANGKVVVFRSSGTNVLPSGGAGVFVRELATGSIKRVNESSQGVIDNGGDRTNPTAISANGRYILFDSPATNLIDGVTLSGNSRTYLRDVKNSTTELVARSPSGAISNGTMNYGSEVSSDGRFVLFMSNATNLHPDATDGIIHLYLLDRHENNIEVIDRKSDGSLSTYTYTMSASMSCDGSIIAFSSSSNFIIGAPSSNHTDVYLLDRRGEVDKLTNLTGFASHAAAGPKVSCNGDYIGFTSAANNIDPTFTLATTGWYRPYIYDRVNNSYHLQSVTATGSGVNSHICGSTLPSSPCVYPSDTGLGVFSVDNSSLTGASGRQVYIRDIYAGTTELVTRDSGGTAGNGSSEVGGVSADGTMIIITSNASNLISGDTNSQQDIFTSLTGY